jgi:peptidoglycan/xylan/chitin deacetylase (PgdA/CDA1 family)
VRNIPPVLMYHYVRPLDAPPAGYSVLGLDTFEAQLDDVCRTMTPVAWPALLDALDGRGGLPADAVMLTFDDGLRDHHRYVLPRLVSRRIPAVFFPLARRPADGLALGHRLHVLIAARGGPAVRSMVRDRLAPADLAAHDRLEAASLEACPGDPEDAWKRPLQRELAVAAQPILRSLIADLVGPEDELVAETYMDERQLTDLVEAGMHLGGHGVDHPWLDAIPRPAVAAEIVTAAAHLSRLLPPPWPFAYPYGGIPPAPAGPLRTAGFAAGFSTAPVHRDRFRLGRFDADSLGPTPSDGLKRR